MKTLICTVAAACVLMLSGSALAQTPVATVNGAMNIQNGSSPDIILGAAGTAQNPGILFYGLSGENAPYSLQLGGQNFTCNSGTVWDPVINLGFNSSSQKVPIVANVPSLGLSMEGNYCNVGNSSMEINLDWTTLNNVAQGRALAYGLDRINGPGPAGYEYWWFGIGDDYTKGSTFAVFNKDLNQELFGVLPGGNIVGRVRSAGNIGDGLTLGFADTASPPGGKEISIQNAAAGNLDLQGGQGLTISSSQGTGTGPGGPITFQVAPAGTSGTAQNALVTALQIISTGAANFSQDVNLKRTSPGAALTWADSARIIVPAGKSFQFSANGGPAQHLQLSSSLLTLAVDQKFTGTIPTVSGTGTPAITTGSTDSAGEVTAGTSATSVMVTFSAAKTNAPFCTVTSQTQLAAFAYAISATAITITQTATSGNKIDYVCFQR